MRKLARLLFCIVTILLIKRVSAQDLSISAIIGDPQFMGLRGQTYQVHGVSGEVYNIISDPDFQYNSRFVFLDAGECPVIGGKRSTGCFSHPGSFLGELGIKTRSGDKIHIVSGNAVQGFQYISLNGMKMEMGSTAMLTDELGTVSYNSTHLVSVVIGPWDLTFENSDMFINQRVIVTDATNLRSHGLLGQTWKDVTYANSIKFLEGVVDDYAIHNSDLFGDDFVFNVFS